MIRVRRITTDHPLYAQECALRERVLLGPVGYTMERFRDEWAGVEEKAEHFVAVFDRHRGGTSVERVAGCVLLVPGHPEPGVGKLMQMAVDPQRQNEGIGRVLVAALEARAFGDLGLRSLVCHARMPAVSFYERLGWKAEGAEFEEVGIPHLRLRLAAPEPAGGAPDPASARAT